METLPGNRRRFRCDSIPLRSSTLNRSICRVGDGYDPMCSSTSRQVTEADGLTRNDIRTCGIAGDNRLAPDRFIGVTGNVGGTIPEIFGHLHAGPAKVDMAFDFKFQTEVGLLF